MGYAKIIQRFPMEWQTPMWELVEAIERDMREQLAVRRQDFEALTNAVEQLAEAQRRTGERLDRVEVAVAQLAEAQRRTEERLEALAEVQRRTEERLDRLEVVVAQLAEAQRRTEERLEALAEAQRRTEEQIQGLERRLRKVENKLSDIDGRTLEARYRERATSYFGPLLRRLRVVDLYSLEEELVAHLAPEEFNELLWLDLVVRGQLRQHPEEPEVWLAVEVSSVVDREDVARARRRADLLRRVGYRVVPVVAGQDMTRGAEVEARKHKVAVLQDGRVLLWEESLIGVGEG